MPDTIAAAAAPIPTRMQRLPTDRLGRPVPYFVQWIDGVPDFRIVDTRRLRACIERRLCWVCGGKLTRHACFVVGPVGTITRTTAEPPSHIECAEFSVRACPFLTHPKMRRNEHNKLAEATSPAGEMIERNPGCAALWLTKEWSFFRDDRGGMLIRVGEPVWVRWYAAGRDATREEVESSIASGIPILQDMARTERDAAAALAELETLRQAAARYLPEEVPA